MSIKYSVPKETIDSLKNSISVELLRLRHAKIESVYVNNQVLPSENYRIKDNMIQVANTIINEDDEIYLYLEIPARKIQIELTASLITAALGILGTIISTFGPYLFDSLHSITSNISSYVLFEPDNYGISGSGDFFRTIVRFDSIHKKDYIVPVEDIEKYELWYFLRVRETMQNIREETIEGVTGPCIISSGMTIECRLTDNMKEQYKNGACIQLVGLAVLKGQKVHNGDKIKDYGEHTRIILSPSFRLSN